MPTPEAAIAALDRLMPLAEQPLGSNNAPPITDWWAMKDAWCNMAVSYAWAHAGFSRDGGRTLHMPGIPQQKPGKGWARVDLMAQAFQQVGRWGTTPRVGAAFVKGYGDGAHTGLVAAIRPNGNLITREGNYQNRLAVVERAPGYVRGFCYAPYTDTPNEEDELVGAADDIKAHLDKGREAQTVHLDRHIDDVRRDVLDAIAQVGKAAGADGAEVDAILDGLRARLES